MRSSFVALLVSLFLSSIAWAQSVDVTFDFEHLPPGEIPGGEVVIARTLTGDLIPGYVPGDPGNDSLPPHIAIRVSRAGTPPRIDSLSLAPGRPPEWGSRTLSPFADPMDTTKMVFEILHVPDGQGVEIIQWEMGDFIPSDFDEYNFQTSVDVPAGTPPPPDPGSWVFVFTRLLDADSEIPTLPPEQEFFGVTRSTQRAYPITRFEIIGGSNDDVFPPDPLPPILAYPHSVYYDNFVFTISPVEPVTNAFAEGTDVPGSDFGGDLFSIGLNGPGDDQNHAPIANASGTGVYECGTDTVVLDGTVSDMDGGDLSYEWALIGPDDDTVLDTGTITVAYGGASQDLPDLPIPSSDLGVGTHTIELRVVDAALAEGVATVYVEVQDTTAPTLVVESSHSELWPPNFKMVTVTIEAKTSDICCDNPTLSVEVCSDEPIDGTGDGAFAPDWDNIVIDQDTDTITLELRAERSGIGDGRTYTVLITATDCHENSSVAPIAISVPHQFAKAKKK